MLARIAHELFGLGRSVAHADHAARILEGALSLQLEGRHDDPSALTLSLESLLAMRGVASDGAPPSQDEVLRILVADPTHPGSIVASINAGRERARAVRDVISLEMWETINILQMHICRDDLPSKLRNEPSAVFDEIRDRCALFWGVQRRSMLRDEGWSFLNAGAEIEAADMVARMLVVTLNVARDTVGDDDTRDGSALTLLRAVGGLQAFRRTTSAAPTLLRVARFLVFHTAFPDSIVASVEGLRRALVRADPTPDQSPPILRLNRLSSDLALRRHLDPTPGDLIDTLLMVQQELADVDQAIVARYFAGAHRPSLTSPGGMAS